MANWSIFCASIEHRRGTDTFAQSKYLYTEERLGQDKAKENGELMTMRF
jgi:hypothetical protein